MTCHGCWLNDLDKTPCIDAYGCQYDISIPATVTLKCYAIMKATWKNPDGGLLLIGLIDDIPVTRNNLTKNEPMRESIACNLRTLTEDLGELQELAKLAQEILPSKIPWSPGCPKRRVIELVRSLKIKHAPFALDDGTGWKRYQDDLDHILKYGQPLLVQSWDQWFTLREEKKREKTDGKRKKSGRGT